MIQNKEIEKKCFSLRWELLGFTLNNFHMAVLIIFIMLDITSLVLIL